MVHLLRALHIAFSFVFIDVTTCFSQSSLLASFSGSQIDQSIHLSFTIKGGITCLGVDIERSPDSLNFITIGTIPGLCGSTNDEVSYSYEDSAPLENQDNFYRLLLGQVGYSETIKVKYFDYTNGPLVIPQPSAGITTIFFPAVLGNNSLLSIYDLAGRLIEEQQINGNAVQVNTERFAHGLLMFVVTDEEKIIFTGKLIVQ